MKYSEDLAEVEQLLVKIRSWSDEEVEQLPQLYRKKAEQYRRLTNTGQE